MVLQGPRRRRPRRRAIVIGLPVALGILYPFVGLMLSPILAALAMSISSVTVISNANRLKRFRPQEVAA